MIKTGYETQAMNESKDYTTLSDFRKKFSSSKYEEEVQMLEEAENDYAVLAKFFGCSANDIAMISGESDKKSERDMFSKIENLRDTHIRTRAISASALKGLTTAKEGFKPKAYSTNDIKWVRDNYWGDPLIYCRVKDLKALLEA